MSFTITGLDPNEFAPLFAMSDDELAERGVIRKTATSMPGFPCRVTLEDAEPGETVLLLNYESHKASSPYRSAYAIFVRDGALAAARYDGDIPPVFKGRPLAMRIFNDKGLLIGADLIPPNGDVKHWIEAAFAQPEAAYIHAHNAAHGCFAAEIRRSD